MWLVKDFTFLLVSVHGRVSVLNPASRMLQFNKCYVVIDTEAADTYRMTICDTGPKGTGSSR